MEDSKSSSIPMSLLVRFKSLWIELRQMKCLHCKRILSMPCCTCDVDPQRGTMELYSIGVTMY
jgi:hypothetical protein